MSTETQQALRRLEEDITQMRFLEEQCRNTRISMERHALRLRSALRACGALPPVVEPVAPYTHPST